MAGQQIVFRRVHGRLVPIKVNRQGPNYADPHAIRGGAQAATAAAGGAYGTIKGVQYALFKRSERLLNISKKYASRPEPRVWVDMKMTKAGKTKLLEPSMFDRFNFRKAQQAHQHNLARAAKYAVPGQQLRKIAGLVSRHSIKVAIGVGVVAGVSAYLGKVALDHSKRKEKKAAAKKKK